MGLSWPAQPCTPATKLQFDIPGGTSLTVPRWGQQDQTRATAQGVLTNSSGATTPIRARLKAPSDREQDFDAVLDYTWEGDEGLTEAERWSKLYKVIQRRERARNY